mmetsp:Transcript_96774/g.270127  ORF Transcript_96774/g.270127 Transcript_96774/m.270127 type:complete len:222 (+) Transcript_96774:1492-2157(+)
MQPSRLTITRRKPAFSSTAYILQSNSITHSSTKLEHFSSSSSLTFNGATFRPAACWLRRTLLRWLLRCCCALSRSFWALARRPWEPMASFVVASVMATFLPAVRLRMAAARYFARLVGSWHSQLMIFISCSSFSSPCMARTWWVSSASSSLVSSAATIREPSPSSALREKVPLSAAYAKTISSGKNMKVIMPSSGSTTCGDQMSSTTMSQKYARIDSEAVT